MKIIFIKKRAEQMIVDLENKTIERKRFWHYITDDHIQLSNYKFERLYRDFIENGFSEKIK